jgi:DNA-binding PadR family transcriptional regulator
MYSPDMRERMVVMMLENGNCTTAAGQNVTTSRNYFYKIMRNLEKRKPNKLIHKEKTRTGSLRIIYKLTPAGEDYAEKVRTIREAEGR